MNNDITQDRSNSTSLVLQQAQQLEQIIGEGESWAANFLRDVHTRSLVQHTLHGRRVTLRKIAGAARRPMALGIFGASQSGKSYLSSELARGQNPVLEILLNDPGASPVKYDYLEEINPPGGRESTAVVTRFTRRPYATVPGCSAHVRFLSAVDLVKIFLNGFLFDCQSEFLPQADDLARLRHSLTGGDSKRGIGVSALTAEEFFDIQDYVKRHFRNPFCKMLEELNYWGLMSDEVSRLSFDRQLPYLEWLWGRIPAMTNLFVPLFRAARQYGGQIVGLYSECLLPRERSIVDVQRLNDLARLGAGTKKVSFRLAQGGEGQLEPALLCALTCELLLTVPSVGDDDSLLAKMDLLDFPGARARAQVFDENRLNVDPGALSDVFLRGKVACLFDRFSDDRDLTGLVLCQEGGPQEAKSIPYMVNKWVEWSHGKDATQRAADKPKLFVAFTKFDLDLVRKKGEDPAVRWESRLQTNFVEFLGQSGDWVEAWAPDKPFQNCFWIRNPNVQQTVFARDRNEEEYIRDEEQLAEIERQYLAHPLVRRFVANPGQAWAKAASPGQSGIQWLLENIFASIPADGKIVQLQANLVRMLSDIRTIFKAHYIGDDITQARIEAEKRGKERVLALGRVMAKHCSLALMLDYERFAISEKVVAMIFDSIANPVIPDEIDEPFVQDTSGCHAVTEKHLDFDEDLFLPPDAIAEETTTTEEPTPQRVVQTKGGRFAGAILAKWQEQLVSLVEDADFLSATGLSSDWYAEVTQELFKGVLRQNIPEQLAQTADQALASPRPGVFKLQQAAFGAAFINRFVETLGCPINREEIPKGPPVATLSPRAYPGIALFRHWSASLVSLFKDNIAAVGADDAAGNEVLHGILGKTREVFPSGG